MCPKTVLSLVNTALKMLEKLALSESTMYRFCNTWITKDDQSMGVLEGH